MLGSLSYPADQQLVAWGQGWMAKGQLPPAVGLWWVQALMRMLALWLVAKRSGGLRRA